MANKVWTGATEDSTWTTAGNWVGGVAPVNGDDVYITGAYSINGIDQSAVSLNSLRVADTYRGSIGASGSYLEIDVAAAAPGVLSYAGKGPHAYLKGDFESVYVNATGAGANALHLFGNGDIDDLIISKGIVTIDSGSTVIDIYMGYATNQLTDARLTVEATVTLTNLRAYGGTTALGSAATLVECKAGTITSTAGAVTTVNVEGGTYNAESTGTITTANLYTGAFDTTGMSRPRTITTLNRWGPCTARLDSPGLVITNHNNYSQHGILELPEGAVAIT